MARSELFSSLSGPGWPELSRDAPFAVFRAVLGAYIVGKRKLSSVRGELVRCVAGSHDRAVSMLHYLRVACESGLLTGEDMHMLATDIQAAVEAAESGPAQKYPMRKLLAGRFEVLSRVGRGGIGEVFLARDLRRIAAGLDDDRVAIKIIQDQHCTCPEAIRSLQREAVNAQCLVHPGIRRVYELDRLDRRFFLVMEWLDGETLAARLDRTKGQPMAAGAFRAILQRVQSALTYAHHHGIVHGDIKPGNVFLTVNGICKLLDFGHTEAVVSPTGNKPFAITHGYSSFEVLSGAQPEIRDDVYSLAVMAYRMIAGRRPFGRHSAVEVEALGLRPECPAMLDESRWRVLRSGLALYREDRPVTVHEFCEGLWLSPARRPQLVVAA